MNRKKAIKTLALIGGGATIFYSGLKGYRIFKAPELEKLHVFQPLIDSLAEAIIPATDSPGAMAAEAGTFVSLMVKDCANRTTQNNFIEGLTDLSLYVHLHYGRSFQDCPADEQSAILKHFEGKGYRGLIGKVQARLLGYSFFSTLKKYTVLGYCLSRPGATEGLRYDYIPGKYIGIVPLQPGQKAWATR